MYTPIPLPVLTTTLQQHWAENFALNVPTHFPGVPTPVEQHPSWVELWIDFLNTPPQRPGGLQQSDLLITVHCFSRDRHNKVLAQQLADAAIATLSQRTLPVLQQQTDTNPATIGWLSIHEPQLRNLSRSDESSRTGSQHLVVSFHGIAQHA